MGGSSPQGLTSHDFHPQIYINPREVFPSIGRQGHWSRASRAGGVSNQHIPHGPTRLAKNQYNCQYTEGANYDLERVSGLSNCRTNGPPTSTALSVCCGDPFQLPSFQDTGTEDDCEDCFDPCVDCLEDEAGCDAEVDQCIEDCDDCEAEHLAVCHDQARNCVDPCDECDFSCFDCIDWNEFEKNKTLGLSYSVPLLNSETSYLSDVQMNDSMTSIVQDISAQTDIPAPPLDLPMHHQCFENTSTFWSDIAQSQSCSGTPEPQNDQTNNLAGLPTNTPTAFNYGCHPATAHHQPAWQMPNYTFSLGREERESQSLQTDSNHHQLTHEKLQLRKKASEVHDQSSDRLESPVRNCQWLMPCGTKCSASFATTSDLRKHIKAIHVTKGTLKCSWEDCNASFATEAALTGHISKKHLPQSAFSHSEEGPFKCTFPGCPKSFMYKQVRDDHVAASHQGNKMYCHICGQFLNGEGSNFRRHMASHRPKHQHMLCKHHHLGCKRRFPRLDNLRRHEACCKFGKHLKGKEAMVLKSDGAGINGGRSERPHLHHHHHHHRHVGH